MISGIRTASLSHSRESGQNKLIRAGGRILYEKWDHGVTTINELGRKVYKRFYSREKALEYMHKNLSSGRWAVYWDRKQSPNFFYAGIETI
jgi:hypothetical protein